MYYLLYTFFYRLFAYSSSAITETNNHAYQFMMADSQITLFGQTMTLGRYLSMLCSLVSLGIILVLCCLFVYKIIKLIGGLIR